MFSAARLSEFKTYNVKVSTIKNAWQTAKDHGVAWTIRRVAYEAQLRTGHHKRKLPKESWADHPLQKWLKPGGSVEHIFSIWKASQPTFFFSQQQQADMAAAIRQVNPTAEQTLRQASIHKLKYFSKLEYDVTYPDIWFTNPFLKPAVQCARDQHWSAYPMYSADYEDLKFIWEPGRFAIVYDLVRAYFLTQDEKFPEQYWQLIESWIAHNPPNTGPHWKCGQETSLRLMAWYFGLFAFLESPATTPERFQQFLRAVAVQVYRVSKDYRYSYIQQSNHAVSEGLGLYVTGVLFPQLKAADQWRKMGKTILEERALFLFRPDGTYFQKSHNYLRFILHAYLYVLVFADANQDTFSAQLKARMKAAVDYLSAVLDQESGFVPNFGSNDGALILPINSCDFRDFRPVLAATHYYFHRNHLFEQGAWHEDLVWLFGSNAVSKVKQKVGAKNTSRRFDLSGIYTLRSTDSWIFTHAESIKDRPAHADALHLDIWWRGINICCDPGTYLYYGHQPWLDAFKHTPFHNTVTIDGKDQMERMYRFTWGYWHDCKMNHFEGDTAIKRLEMEHNGYARLADPVIHKRAVIGLPNDYWIVIDDLLGKAVHEVQLNWLFADFDYTQTEHTIQLFTPKGEFKLGTHTAASSTIQITRGNKDKGTAGLKSNYYGYLESAIQLKHTQKTMLPTRIITCLGAADWQYTPHADQNFTFHTPEKSFTIYLHPFYQTAIVKTVNETK